MNEQQCKDFIKKDVQEMAALCAELLAELDGIDLNEIDRRLDQLVGKYGKAKKRLLDCEDF